MTKLKDTFLESQYVWKTKFPKEILSSEFIVSRLSVYLRLPLPNSHKIRKYFLNEIIFLDTREIHVVFYMHRVSQ